jgi:hypothetical protein
MPNPTLIEIHDLSKTYGDNHPGAPTFKEALRGMPRASRAGAPNKNLLPKDNICLLLP